MSSCEHHLFLCLDPRNNGEACCAEICTQATCGVERLLWPPDVAIQAALMSA